MSLISLQVLLKIPSKMGLLAVLNKLLLKKIIEDLLVARAKSSLEKKFFLKELK